LPKEHVKRLEQSLQHWLNRWVIGGIGVFVGSLPREHARVQRRSYSGPVEPTPVEAGVYQKAQRLLQSY